MLSFFKVDNVVFLGLLLSKVVNLVVILFLVNGKEFRIYCVVYLMIKGNFLEMFIFGNCFIDLCIEIKNDFLLYLVMFLSIFLICCYLFVLKVKL